MCGHVQTQTLTEVLRDWKRETLLLTRAVRVLPGAPGAWPQTWMHSLLVLDPAVQNLGVQFSGSGSEGSVVRAASLQSLPPPARPVSAFAPCPCPSRTPVTGLSPAPSRGWFHLGTLSSESHLHRPLCKMRSHLEVLGVRARSSLFGATV